MSALSLAVLAACGFAGFCERFKLDCKDSDPVLVPDLRDEDRDGFLSDVDCDDQDPDVHPAKAEVCDGRDQDCDGEIDEGYSYGSFWPDADGDGLGDPAGEVYACMLLEDPAWVQNGSDCDDTNSQVGSAQTYWPDNDRDGYGIDEGQAELCPGESEGWSRATGDCDDTDPEIFPQYYYPDADGDGVGSGDPEIQCGPGVAWSLSSEDCDDSDPVRATGLPEACDGHDNDCDIEVDEGLDGCRRLYRGIVSIDGVPEWVAGADANHYLGIRLSPLGDLNGDGLADLLISAEDKPYTWLLLGRVGPLAGRINFIGGPLRPEDPDGREVFAHGVGDLDGDGFPEVGFALVHETCDEDSVEVQIRRGTATWSELFSPFTWISFQAPARCGVQDVNLRGLPDVDGDGTAELAVGAGGFGETGRGGVWLIPGPFSAEPEDVSARGIFLSGGAEGSTAGRALASPGDVDGDGLADLLVGAPGLHGGAKYSGGAYLLRGRADWEGLRGGDLDDSDALLTVDVAGARLGEKLAEAADLDGDGYLDMALGACGYGRDGLEYEGAVFLVQGRAGLEGLTVLEPSTTPAILGGEGSQTACVVAGGQDVDGDGRADVLVGAPVGGERWTTIESRGRLFLGGPDLFAAVAAPALELVASSTYTELGLAVALPGDMDGDGWSDLVISDPEESPWSGYEGLVYVLRGGP